jgi:hypothetical protein
MLDRTPFDQHPFALRPFQDDVFVIPGTALDTVTARGRWMVREALYENEVLPNWC